MKVSVTLSGFFFSDTLILNSPTDPGAVNKLLMNSRLSGGRSTMPMPLSMPADTSNTMSKSSLRLKGSWRCRLHRASVQDLLVYHRMVLLQRIPHQTGCKVPGNHQLEISEYEFLLCLLDCPNHCGLQFLVINSTG